MKLTTGLALLSAAIASSRTVVVRDSSDDVQDLNIADVFGDPIPGENPFTFCKGDRSKDAVCYKASPVSVTYPLLEGPLEAPRKLHFDFGTTNLTN